MNFEAKDNVKTNLLSRYEKNKLIMSILETEKACDQEKGVVVESTNYECREEPMTLLEKTTKELTAVMSSWERWIPALSKGESDSKAKNLRTARDRLAHQKAEFVS